MKQTIMGTIVKSPRGNEFIKGPIRSMTRAETKIIVNYFKERNEWTPDFINNNPLIIAEVLLSKISSPAYIYHDFEYCFSPFGVDEYFNLENIQLNLKMVTISPSNQLVSVFCLGNVTTKMIVDQYPWHDFDRRLEITENNYHHFFKRKPVSVFYEFNFDQFSYFVEKADVRDYVVYSNEKWWNMEELTFLPLVYINN